MSNYREPWYCSAYREVLDATHRVVVDSMGFEFSEDAAARRNRQRIVACVNACAGISTEVLVGADGTVAVLQALQARKKSSRPQAPRRLPTDLQAAVDRVLKKYGVEPREGQGGAL